MISRNYNYSDETLIQYASDQLSYLQEDLSAFEAFDEDLGAAKRDAMQVLTDWALSEGGDEVNVSRLGGYTEKVQEEMENARKLYGQLRYWVAKAFPGRKAVQRQFGIGRFSKIADSQEALIRFMSGLAESVNDYRTQLEAAKAPVTLLDSVAGQASALRAANDAQEKKKGNRTVDTEDRIRKLNELHRHTRDYNAAAEHVFYDSAAKRDRYRTPANNNTVEAVDEVDI